MTRTTIAFAEQLWQKRLLGSPRGSLLLHNSFFEELHKKDKLYMFHATTTLDGITDQGCLYSSGGCLIGSIYCAPLFSESKGLRAHNLGAYVFERETPRCLEAKSLKDRSIDAIVIEVDISTFRHTEPIGVSYLHMGNIHLKTYQALAEGLPPMLRERLEGNVVEQIKKVQLFLQTCSTALQKGKEIDTEQFFALLTSAIGSLPILGYIYFEALSEYLILFSQDKRSQQFMAKGELNCWGYKECIFRLRPNLLRNFSLATFNPSITELGHALRALEQEELVRIRFAALLEYVKERIVFLVNACLLGSREEQLSWSTLTWQFDELATMFPCLVGHAIDREARRVDQYRGFHFLFDERKAASIWNYWQAMGIAVPFNGILPKGEIGINPAHTNLKYKVYRGRPQHMDNELYIQPAEELAVQILPRLIHPKYSFMGIGG